MSLEPPLSYDKIIAFLKEIPESPKEIPFWDLYELQKHYFIGSPPSKFSEVMNFLLDKGWVEFNQNLPTAKSSGEHIFYHRTQAGTDAIAEYVSSKFSRNPKWV